MFTAHSGVIAFGLLLGCVFVILLDDDFVDDN